MKKFFFVLIILIIIFLLISIVNAETLPIKTSSPKTVLPTKTILSTATVSPTKTVLSTATVSPTKSIMSTATVSPTKNILSTTTVSPTKTVMSIATVKPTKTVLSTATVSPIKTITPTKTISPPVSKQPFQSCPITDKNSKNHLRPSNPFAAFGIFNMPSVYLPQPANSQTINIITSLTTPDIKLVKNEIVNPPTYIITNPLTDIAADPSIDITTNNGTDRLSNKRLPITGENNPIIVKIIGILIIITGCIFLLKKKCLN